MSRYLPKNTAIAFTDKAFVKSIFRLIPGFIFLGGASLLILEKAPWTQQLSRIVIILALFYLLQEKMMIKRCEPFKANKGNTVTPLANKAGWIVAFKETNLLGAIRTIKVKK